MTSLSLVSAVPCIDRAKSLRQIVGVLSKKCHKKCGDAEKGEKPCDIGYRREQY